MKTIFETGNFSKWTNTDVDIITTTADSADGRPGLLAQIGYCNANE
jgi:hypothetical protein